MQVPDFLTIAEQVAAHLRGELLRGRWSGTMPGMNHLAPKLGVNAKTVEASLRLLEKEGMLASQGAGRGRRIVPSEDQAPRALQVAILGYEPLALMDSWMLELQHSLEEAGHFAFFTEKCLLELRMDVKRVANLVAQTTADAWVVNAGSREILEWFCGQSTPALALSGRLRGLPIAGAGPDKPPTYAAATRRLMELGHRRIVLVVRRNRRSKGSGHGELAFLAELAAKGIATGPFNLPNWEESIDGFQRLLDSLFGSTPPTAMIIDEVPFFAATQQYLARRGLRVPEDVSLICTDGDPSFEWCKPSIAHISWDHRPMVRRIVRWANKVARGKDDRRQTFTKAEFVEGGTIGPVKATG